MKKFKLFLFAAMLLGSIGLHAQTFFTVGNFRYTIMHEPDPFLPSDVGTVSVGLVQYDGDARPLEISGFAYYEQKSQFYYITVIDRYGFARYTASGVTVGSPVIGIGSSAFEDCTGLTFATMDNTVEVIGASAFEGCTKLNTVTLCSSVKEIAANAFENCTSLKTVYCYAITPPSLGTDVFKNVPQDLSIYVLDVEAYKKQWTQLSPSCFKPLAITIEENGIKYELFVENTRYKARVVAKDGGYTGNIVIPEQVTYQGLTFTVAEIGQAAFSRCSGLTSITIPNSVTQIGKWAFEFCSNLQNINLQSSIKSINVGTFQWAGLTSITIPASVERIENYAFWACPLEYVACMSETPPALADGATFPDAKKALVYVPNINAIAAYQNSDWNKYFTNFITNTITYKSYVQLTGNQFNVGATTFGPAITSHTFSNGTGTIICNGVITQIGKDAFSNCHSLTSIDIPNSVRTIDINAFLNCTSLTSVKVNWTNAQSIVSINNNVFQGIANGAGPAGATLYVPAGTIDLYKQANGWKDFGNIMVTPNTITYYASERLQGHNGSLNVGAFTFGPAITSHEFSNGTGTITCSGSITTIGERAFGECKNLTSVTIPNSVTTIGTSAFEGCSGLTSIYIPASVKEIKDWAFKNCTQLKDLQFAERTDAINIATYAFENMAIEDLVIPDWMTVIPEGLFYGNQKLEIVYLPELVNNIASRSFENCPKLKYIISMAETPPILAEGAFKGHDKDDKVIVYVPTSDAVIMYKNSNWGKYFTNFYSNVTYKITTPTTVEVVHAIPANGAVNLLPVVTLQGTNYNVVGIGNEALKGDTSLRSISLPATIQYIGDSAFSGCTKLKQTNSRAWEDLQTIGASAFYGCSALDSIVIPEGVQTIGKSAFMGCSKLTSISLPTGLKNIPDECFNQCPLGQEIIVPEGVETIGQTAFNGTKETQLRTESITLPSTLKEINLGAFYYRDGLKEIICHALTPPTLTAQAFASKQFQAQQITVYVPNRDVVTAYKRSNWGDSILYNFKFSDLMAEENKQYLYTVAGNNDEAKKIAKAYCDSIDRATTTQQVQYYINTALTKIDKYTLNDYKIKLANYLDSVAGENLDALRIAEEYRKKILLAIFRQEAEKIFAEGLAKINAVFELIDFKKACCDNLRNSAQNLGKEIKEIAEEYCILINQATTKEEANRIYLDGAQEISMYMQLSRYWKEPSEPGECRTTYGYPK